jgi:hypothetical protein
MLPIQFLTEAQSVTAAVQEGKVVIAIPLGESYPHVVANFQKAYPAIKAETFSIHTRDFMVRFGRKDRRDRSYGTF